MEGDPLIEGRARIPVRYLRRGKGAGQFQAFWAHDRTAEREATKAGSRVLRAHIRAHPEAHIYHYGHYEVTALKRLASGHGVGEAILDQLLRQQRFVDLYRIVQQGLIASEPGDRSRIWKYSTSTNAQKRWRPPAIVSSSMSDGATARTTPSSKASAPITRPTAARPRGSATGSLKPFAPRICRGGNPTNSLQTKASGTTIRYAPSRNANSFVVSLSQLTGRLAGEPAELLFELAWFHEREDKPKWWAMFDRAERDTEELIDDPDSLGGLVAIGVARPEKKSQVRTYRYPQQETKLRETL